MLNNAIAWLRITIVPVIAALIYPEGIAINFCYVCNMTGPFCHRTYQRNIPCWEQPNSAISPLTGITPVWEVNPQMIMYLIPGITGTWVFRMTIFVYILVVGYVLSAYAML